MGDLVLQQQQRPQKKRQRPQEEEEEVIRITVPAWYSDRSPSGYWFDPTDQELVVYYLSTKVSGLSGLRYDPSTIIPTVDVYGPSSEPWRLCEQVAFPSALTPTEFFCFTTRNQLHSRGDRCHRTAGFGTWYSEGKEKEIWHGGVLVGRSSFLSFKVPPRGVTGTVAKNHMVGTHWVMYEYRLESGGTQFQKTVICRIRNQKKDEQISKGQWKTPWWEEMCPSNDDNTTTSNSVTRKRTMMPSPPCASSCGTGETFLGKRPSVVSGGDPSCGSTMQVSTDSQPPGGDSFPQDDPFFPLFTFEEARELQALLDQKEDNIMFTFDELMGTDDGGTTGSSPPLLGDLEEFLQTDVTSMHRPQGDFSTLAVFRWWRLWATQRRWARELQDLLDQEEVDSWLIF